MRNLIKKINYAINNHNTQEAETLINLGAYSSPQKADWPVLQALTHIKSQQFTLATLYLHNAIKTSPKVETLYLQLGQLYLKQCHPESALATFHQGLIKFPVSTILLKHYIQCARQLKLTQSRLLEERAGLLLSLVGFEDCEALHYCYDILLPKKREIGVTWLVGDKLHGWIIDPTHDNQHIHLLIIAGDTVSQLIANQASPELKKIGIGNGYNGFTLDVKLAYEQIDIVSMRNRTRLFGSPVRTYTTQELLTNPYKLHEREKNGQKFDSLVDIIIPVYNNLTALKQCLDSLSNATNTQTQYHIVIVDDCSTCSLLKDFLQQFTLSTRSTLLTNPCNAGFITSVNRGLQKHPWRDVVLLNSDTIVANDWLDRLYDVAYSNARFATVTPLSNYAEKFSFPTPLKVNDLPSVNSIKNIDKTAAHANSGKAVEVPTGNGFCFFIKRDCLNHIGHFNQTDLLRGYSEESEFCLRASEKGWKHVCATNVYIGHHGGGSFKHERSRLAYLNNRLINQKYPYYSPLIQRFISNDPLKEARKRIERKILKQHVCDCLLIADHHAYSHPLFKEQLATLTLSGKSVWTVTLVHNKTQSQLQLRTVHAQGPTNLDYHCSTQFNALISDVKCLNPQTIHVHHSTYFPDILNKLLVTLTQKVSVYPYDLSLQHHLPALSWVNHIQSIHVVTDFAFKQYTSEIKIQKLERPDCMGNRSHRHHYSPYIAILNDITCPEHEQLLYQLVQDWQQTNLPLKFIIAGSAFSKHALESSQRIIFTHLKIQNSTELQKLCTHAFILPNTSDLIPADLILALQSKLNLISVLQDSTEELLTAQSTAIIIKPSRHLIDAIKLAFHHYAKKVTLNDNDIIPR